MSAEVVIHPYASTAVNGGSTTLFTCLSYGIPTPSIVWSQGGYHLSNGTHTNIEEELVTENKSRVVFVKSLLRICNTELADSGSYSCIANNTGGNNSFDFELTLLDEGIVFYTENCACQLYLCQILFCRAVPCRGCDPSIPNHQHGCWHYYCTDLCRLWCTSSICELE